VTAPSCASITGIQDNPGTPKEMSANASQTGKRRYLNLRQRQSDDYLAFLRSLDGEGNARSCSEATKITTVRPRELMITLPPLMIKLVGRVLLLTSV
jgi:hypothetical protein